MFSFSLYSHALFDSSSTINVSRVESNLIPSRARSRQPHRDGKSESFPRVNSFDKFVNRSV